VIVSLNTCYAQGTVHLDDPPDWQAVQYEVIVHRLLAEVAKWAGTAPIWPTAKVRERKFHDSMLIVTISISIQERS
jgi:hypothetical protein